MRTTSLLLRHRNHGVEAIVAFEHTDERHRRKRRALDSPSAQAEEIAHRDVARHHQPQSRGHKKRPAPLRGTSFLCVEHETRFELATLTLATLFSFPVDFAETVGVAAT